MINPMMTDKQNERMFATKRQMAEFYIDRLYNDTDYRKETLDWDMEMYITLRFYNYYTQVLNEDFDCEYDYMTVLEDMKWEPRFKMLLKDLEGVEDYE